MDSYASDASAWFALSRPPGLAGCSAQPLRATPATAFAPRGVSSASLPRGDAPVSSAHRRALSASDACGRQHLLPSPPRGDKPDACAFHRRRHQLAPSKKPPSEANAAAATASEARAATKSVLTRPVSSSPRSLQRGSLYYFPGDESTRKQSAAGAEEAACFTTSPQAFTRSKATVVARHTLAPQEKRILLPVSQVVASQAAPQTASDSAAQAAPLAAAEAALSAAAGAASGVISRYARSFFLRTTPRGCPSGNSASAGPSSSTTPASPTSSASSAAVRIYSSSSAPSSPCTPLPCTRICRTSSPPTTSSGRTSSPPTSRVGEADAMRRHQPVCVKPCLTAPTSTRRWGEAGSPKRSPNRVSFVKYVEILEYVP
ncbi:unnamed protein product [Closterium sp. NIES-54]